MDCIQILFDHRFVRLLGSYSRWFNHTSEMVPHCVQTISPDSVSRKDRPWQTAQTSLSSSIPMSIGLNERCENKRDVVWYRHRLLSTYKMPTYCSPESLNSCSSSYQHYTCETNTSAINTLKDMIPKHSKSVCQLLLIILGYITAWFESRIQSAYELSGLKYSSTRVQSGILIPRGNIPTCFNTTHCSVYRGFQCGRIEHTKLEKETTLHSQLHSFQRGKTYSSAPHCDSPYSNSTTN